MSYHGDIRLGDTIDVKFTSRRFSTGAPYTLAGTPAVSAYVGNGTTEITAGITLTVDFDGRTGLNNVRVVASGANGYAAATNVQLVITAGTVDSVSVVGEVVGEFSIENRSAVMPTTAGRTLDVSAGGEAGVDWANVGSPTTTVNLSGTTVKTATDVETDTADIQGRLPAALVSGRMDASVGAMAAAVVTAAAIATDAIDADALAADAVTEIQAGLSTLTAAGVRTAVGLASANLDTQLAAIDDYLDTEVAAIKAKTDNLPASPAAVGSAMTLADGSVTAAALAADAGTEIADAILKRDMSAVSGESARSLLNAIRKLMNKWSISGSTLTVCKEDDSTTAYTQAIGTTAGADPITSLDTA